jgi:hypothetical protein
LDIPSSNLFFEFDEDSAHAIYDEAVKNYNEAILEKRIPEHVLFVFDDLGYTNLQNKNKKNSILDKIVSNGRKFLISIISLNQRITQLNTNAREQASGIILWSSTNKSLELLEKDFNYLPSKKQFLKMVHKHTSNSKHDFIVMDLEKKNKYFNKEFKPICNCTDDNQCGGDVKAPE